jgi:ATP-dependent protease ClpP protease subunit
MTSERRAAVAEACLTLQRSKHDPAALCRVESLLADDAGRGYWTHCGQDLFLFNDVQPEGTSELVEAIRAAAPKPLRIFVDSAGGDARSAMRIIRAIVAHGEVHAHVVDRAWSAAHFIARACHTCTISPSGSILDHDIVITACGNPTELRLAADQLEKFTEQFWNELAAPGIAPKVEPRRADSIRYLAAQQAVEAGICSGISDDVPMLEKPSEKYDRITLLLAQALKTLNPRPEILEYLRQPGA